MGAPFREHPKLCFTLLALGLVLVMVASLTVGSKAVNIPVERVVGIVLSRLPLIGRKMPEYSDKDISIIILVRLPRLLMGVLVGAGLSVSGSSMQGIFRNPLASPYILGVSAGGALGASIAIVLGLGLFWLPIFAFILGMSTAFLVFFLGRVNGRIDTPSLLLAGIAVGSFMGALTSYIKFMSHRGLQDIVFWIMGGLHGSMWSHVFILIPLISVSSAIVLFFSRELNVLQTGEESASQLGVEVQRSKVILLCVSSLLASAVVAFTGVIGFVGLIMPHSARLLVGPNHRHLIPTSAVLGALFLVGCDTLVRLMGNMPVGIVTGLFGAPFFIYLLVKNRGDTGW